MSWDSSKSPGDLIASADYNDGVTDQKTRGIPCSENKTGIDCTGSDGDANRTLTLAEATIKSGGLTITVNGTTLHEGAGKDFTLSSNVITFLNKIWDANEIRIVYFT